MKQPPHFLRLADDLTHGLACDVNGLSLGGTPLLVRAAGCMGLDEWRLRPLANINRDLTLHYGFPIDVANKLAGIRAVARALEAGDVARAQLIALQLRFPDPPRLSKVGDISPIATAILALELQASGLLKLDWDPSLHPRWPAGSPDSTGGEFAPGGAAGAPGTPSSAHFDQADVPFDDLAPLARPMTIPKPIPRPGEVLPPPLVGPMQNRPRSAECDKEWDDALRFCKGLEDKGQLGKHPYEWMGRTVKECARGEVSFECGGNPVV